MSRELTPNINLRDLLTVQPISSRLLNLFWGGFILYVLNYVLRKNIHYNDKVGALLELIGLIIMFSTSIFLVKWKIVNNYFKVFFVVYIFWAIIVIFRGFKYDQQSLLYMLLNADYGVFLYLVPLIILFPQNLNFYKKIFDVCVVLGIFFFIVIPFYKNDLLDRSFETQDVIEFLARNLALPCGFILLTYTYHSNKRIIISFLTICAALLFSVYKARRGLSITISSVLIFSFFLYLFSTKKKIFVIYLSALLLCLGLLYVNSIYNINNNKLLNFIAERGEEDTRTGVELYFYNDMHTKDWIIGRGINGEYYCPGVEQDTPSDYRTLIETGYLQIILKGGLIRLIIFLLIAVPAVFLGLFSSRNLLSKASALWIIVALISLYPATVESFSLQYLLVWMSIGICYSRKLRKISDEKFIEFFKQSSLNVT